MFLKRRAVKVRRNKATVTMSEIGDAYNTHSNYGTNNPHVATGLDLDPTTLNDVTRL